MQIRADLTGTSGRAVRRSVFSTLERQLVVENIGFPLDECAFAPCGRFPCCVKSR